MPTITLTWHSVGDDRTCKICKALDNFVWVFETGKNVMTDALFHPTFGIVWSLSEGSNAHSRGYLSGHDNNCRCEIEEQIFLEDVLAKCVFLKETITETLSETKAGAWNSSRKTTFEDIGIDPAKYGLT